MPRVPLALLLTILFAAGPGLAIDLEAAEPLFQKHCSTCHHVDRALKKHKDRAGWDKTVKRMQGYASGMMSNEDAVAIVEYLTLVRGPEN